MFDGSNGQNAQKPWTLRQPATSDGPAFASIAPAQSTRQTHSVSFLSGALRPALIMKYAPNVSSSRRKSRKVRAPPCQCSASAAIRSYSS